MKLRCITLFNSTISFWSMSESLHQQKRSNIAIKVTIKDFTISVATTNAAILNAIPITEFLTLILLIESTMNICIDPPNILNPIKKQIAPKKN